MQLQERKRGDQTDEPEQTIANRPWEMSLLQSFRVTSVPCCYIDTGLYETRNAQEGKWWPSKTGELNRQLHHEWHELSSDVPSTANKAGCQMINVERLRLRVSSRPTHPHRRLAWFFKPKMQTPRLRGLLFVMDFHNQYKEAPAPLGMEEMHPLRAWRRRWAWRSLMHKKEETALIFLLHRG